jgi:hypothetical protein
MRMIGNTPTDGHRWLHTMVELLTGYLEGRVDVEWNDDLRLEVTLDWWDAGTSRITVQPHNGCCGSAWDWYESHARALPGHPGLAAGALLERNGLG